MTSRTLKITVAALLFQTLLLRPAMAQDFNDLVNGAASANRQAVDQVNQAMAAQDEATFRSRASDAVVLARQTESQLTQALSLAPDDASRSRVEGVLKHITAAVQAGQAAVQTSDFNAARGKLDAMRGEVQEALTELVPFAEARPPAVPPTLPSAGELPASPPAGFTAALLALIGLLAVATGLSLRHTSPSPRGRGSG